MSPPDAPAIPHHLTVRETVLFQVAIWGFFLGADLLLLSIVENISWPKAVNVTLGVLLSAACSVGFWSGARRIRWQAQDDLRQSLCAFAACVTGGGVIAVVMHPVERWAKLADPGLPPADLRGLWIFYSLMLGLWCACAAAFVLHSRTRRIEIERARFAAAAREAEIHAMRLQINPHFLFNSFATLRALVELDPARARVAITQLSNMMRYSLERAGQPTVPLREELAIVGQYLELEGLRLEGRLRVTADCDTGLEDTPVPPMSLQTLVENAVKFGIAPRRAGGDLHYALRIEGDTLVITVRNPGHLGAPSTSTGLGLANLRGRLAYLYGDRGTLTLEQSADDEVCATVRLPLTVTPTA